MLPFALAPEQIEIDADPNDIGLYQFGTKVAKHYFCKHCGIYTHHETLRQPGHYRINIGCVDNLDSLSLPFDVFDGASL